ncbi:MAG: hypothetical protein AB8H80_08215 [Planctomycetota bacterium]
MSLWATAVLWIDSGLLLVPLLLVLALLVLALGVWPVMALLRDVSSLHDEAASAAANMQPAAGRDRTF